MLTASRFAALLPDVLARCDGLSLRECPLPTAYAVASRPLPQGELRLENRFIAIEHGGELRAVLIHAPKIDIVTLFFFPLAVRALPVFAMEFVVLGQQPVVAVIDAPCLTVDATAQAATAHVLRAAHAACPDVLAADDPPDWYQNCRSGLDFFIRPRDMAELERLGTVCLNVLAGIIEQFQTAAWLSATAAAEHAERLQAYKDHHRQHSPGLPLLQRHFGAAWTADYLAEHLFR